MDILICDDMRNEAKRLGDMLDGLGFDIDTRIFCSGKDTLAYVHAGGMADACFLDIVMPEMTGVDLAKKLRSDGFAGDIIFLTNSNEYAAESYMVGASYYLLKPPTPDSVRDILQKLINARQSDDRSGILIKSKKVARFIFFRDISYVEVIQHKVYFQLINGEGVEMSTTLLEILPQLMGDLRFAQCHRSFIVNMNAISTISGMEITMCNGIRITISKRYSSMKKRYLQWVFGGGKG